VTYPGSLSAADVATHRHLMRFGEAESLVSPVWQQHDTSLAAIDAHLSGLWAHRTPGGEEVVTEKGLAHARASVLNLVVSVPDEDSAERVVQTMLSLGYRHPSRALVLVTLPAAAPGLDAAISAHCHPAATAGEEVCYEEVVLTVRGEAARHLSGVVAPLLIHDLPTHVWWPGAPPFADPVFDQLVALSDRLIVDSSHFSELLGGLRRLTSLRRRSGIGDLAWERLVPWQELTAQFFDGPRFRRYLPNLSRLIVRYATAPGEADAPAPVASPAGALLFAGWIASRLEWRRYRTTDQMADGGCRLQLEGRHEMVDLRIEPVETTAAAPGELLSARLRAYGETGAGEFIIDREGDEATVVSNADGMTALLRRVRMEPRSDGELLAASLLNDQHDPLYEAALRAAVVFLDAAQGQPQAESA